MNLPYYNDPPITQSLRTPAMGLAISALLHGLFWVLLLSDKPPPEPDITPAQVIEVALVAAPPQAAPEPPQPQVKPPPLPPPPKPEKPPEKPAPKKPEKPKPKPEAKKEPRPEPAKEAEAPPPPATTGTAVDAPPAPAPVKAAAPNPAPFVEASYKSPTLRNPPTRYPRLALERRWEGKVTLRVQVLPSGSPGEIRIESSSGYEILDDATVEQVQGWRFIPARRGDQAVASWVIVPIEYKLKH